MAKTMAVITQGLVTNMIWCSGDAPETDTRKDPGGRPVGIGDTYSGGKWYRDGDEILTPLEQAQKLLAELQAQNSDMQAALDAIYEGEMV